MSSPFERSAPNSCARPWQKRAVCEAIGRHLRSSGQLGVSKFEENPGGSGDLSVFRACRGWGVDRSGAPISMVEPQQMRCASCYWWKEYEREWILTAVLRQGGRASTGLCAVSGKPLSGAFARVCSGHVNGMSGPASDPHPDHTNGDGEVPAPRHYRVACTIVRHIPGTGTFKRHTSKASNPDRSFDRG